MLINLKCPLADIAEKKNVGSEQFQIPSIKMFIVNIDIKKT